MIHFVKFKELPDLLKLNEKYLLFQDIYEEDTYWRSKSEGNQKRWFINRL